MHKRPSLNMTILVGEVWSLVLRAMPKEDGASLRFGDWGAPKQRRRNRQKVQISVTLYRLKSPDAESFSSLN